MTVTLTEPTAGADVVGADALPRVNLIPTEITVTRRFRRVQGLLGLVVLATVVLIGLLVFLATGRVNRAQERLDAAQARTATLERELATYRPVEGAYRAVDTARDTLRTALGGEVRFSRFLADLSITVPDSVQFKTLTVTVGAPSPDQAAAAAAAAAGVIGSVSVGGLAASHDDVAAWLDAVAKRRGMADPYFTTASRVVEGSGTAVKFESTAALMRDALSGRYADEDGGLP